MNTLFYRNVFSCSTNMKIWQGKYNEQFNESCRPLISVKQNSL